MNDLIERIEALAEGDSEISDEVFGRKHPGPAGDGAVQRYRENKDAVGGYAKEALAAGFIVDALSRGRQTASVSEIMDMAERLVRAAR